MDDEDLAKITYSIFITIMKINEPKYKVYKYKDLPPSFKVAWKAAIDYAYNQGIT